jgi:hypothetical protein
MWIVMLVLGVAGFGLLFGLLMVIAPSRGERR